MLLPPGLLCMWRRVLMWDYWVRSCERPSLCCPWAGFLLQYNSIGLMSLMSYVQIRNCWINKQLFLYTIVPQLSEFKIYGVEKQPNFQHWMKFCFLSPSDIYFTYIWMNVPPIADMICIRSLFIIFLSLRRLRSLKEAALFWMTI